MTINQTARRELNGRTSQDVARELLEQPELLDGLLPDAKPRTFIALPAVQRYTGERSTSAGHEERNLLVGALRLIGASDREIEAACHSRGLSITRRSIPLILQDLEKTRRITPLKERLAELVGDNAEQSALALRALLDKAMTDNASVELAGMIKAVATSLGITTQNLQLLTGAATEILEVRVGSGRDEVEAWAKANAIPIQATAEAVDTVSAGNLTISEATPALQPMRHDSDTGPTAGPPSPSELVAASDLTEQAGGGVALSSGGPETSMHTQGAKF